MEGSDDRYFSMSITSFGPSTLNQKEKAQLETRKINETSDIEGATRTTTLYEKYGNKTQFLQTDVPGSNPKALTHSRNSRDMSLYIDDIEGTRAKALDKMAATKRRVNPLEPEYPLPSYIPVDPHEPKFLRHTMDISDIDGTATQPLKRQTYALRDSYRVDDIVGAQPNWKPRHERVRHERDPKDIMDIGDIAKKTHRWIDRTGRECDPVAPIYHINGMDSYDDPQFTKPTRPKPFLQESMLLVTKDINNGLGYPMQRPRRDFSRTNFCGDIDGAMPDTIKHAIVTNRQTNPLAPVYQGLDYGDPLPPLLMPLLPATMVNSATLRPKLAPEDMDMRPKESISKMGDTSSAGAAISGHGGPTADYHWSYKTFRDFKDGSHGSTVGSAPKSHSSRSQGNGHGHGQPLTNQDTHSGYGESQYRDYYSGTSGGDDELVMFTGAKPPMGPSGRDHKVKLDLELHSGRGAVLGSARPTSDRGVVSGRGSGLRGASPRPGTLSVSGTLGLTGLLGSGRGLPPMGGGLGSGLGSGRMGSGRSYTAPGPGLTGTALRAQRELQAEIDSVRAL